MSGTEKSGRIKTEILTFSGIFYSNRRIAKIVSNYYNNRKRIYFFEGHRPDLNRPKSPDRVRRRQSFVQYHSGKRNSDLYRQISSRYNNRVGRDGRNWSVWKKCTVCRYNFDRHIDRRDYIEI